MRAFVSSVDANWPSEKKRSHIAMEAPHRSLLFFTSMQQWNSSWRHESAFGTHVDFCCVGCVVNASGVFSRFWFAASKQIFVFLRQNANRKFVRGYLEGSATSFFVFGQNHPVCNLKLFNLAIGNACCTYLYNRWNYFSSEKLWSDLFNSFNLRFKGSPEITIVMRRKVKSLLRTPL